MRGRKKGRKKGGRKEGRILGRKEERKERGGLEFLEKKNEVSPVPPGFPNEWSREIPL